MQKIALLLVLFSQGVWAHEIAVIGGHPDRRLDFSQNLVKAKIAYVPENATAIDYATQVYSILARRQVADTVAYRVLGPNASTTQEIAVFALEDAAKRAKVVLFTLGPKNLTMCNAMRNQGEALFVVIYEAGAPYSCEADNIVSVAGLNGSLDGVPGLIHPDHLPDIAAPATNISVIGAGGRYLRANHSAAAAVFVAAKAAALSREFPDLKGRDLADALYDLESTAVPALEGKVQGARRLNDDGK